MANTYLPTANLSPLLTFIQYSSTAAALQTALVAAFPEVASIQCFDDAAHEGNVLVVANDEQVFTVPSGSYVGYNAGQWTQYNATDFANKFTAYGS